VCGGGGSPVGGWEVGDRVAEDAGGGGGWVGGEGGAWYCHWVHTSAVNAYSTFIIAGHR
jgi:hypothetical protein